MMAFGVEMEQMASSSSPVSTRDAQPDRLLVVAPLMVTYVLLCLRDAWIADDAFITLRSARNLAEHFEPNFNLGIRVQAFTSEAWHAVLAVVYWVIPHGYLVLLGASLAAATATTALLLCRVVPRDRGVAPIFLLGALLLSSRSYVDYSTSGMENALLHLLVVVLYLFWDRPNDPNVAASSRTWSRNILLTSIALVMTRLDHAPLALPFAWAAVVSLWPHFKRWPLCRRLLLYGSPFLLWKVFSIFYYGSLLPNSALSKLSHGQPIGEMLAQGIGYLYSSLFLDPVLVITILVAVVVGWFSPRGRSRPLAIAIVLQVATCIWVGGDFMGGRFLTASFVLAAIVIAREVSLTHSPALGQLVAVVAVVGLSLLGTRPVWTTSLEGSRKSFDARGVVDEASAWSVQTGLWNVGRDLFMPVGHRRESAARFQGPGPYFGETLGIEAFYGDERARVFDGVALVDPLLSRMPSVRRAPQRH
jgi:arabinofuranosyltransferase